MSKVFPNSYRLRDAEIDQYFYLDVRTGKPKGRADLEEFSEKEKSKVKQVHINHFEKDKLKVVVVLNFLNDKLATINFSYTH